MKYFGRINGVVLSLIIFIIFIIFAGEGMAQNGDAPEEFLIRNIRMIGEACSQDSATVVVSEDRRAFTAIFDSFYIESTQTSGDTEQRKSCRLIFDLDFPEGWQFAVMGVTARGYANLDAGVVGRQILKFGIGGRSDKERSIVMMRGPSQGDYVHAADFPLSSLEWSGCRRARAARMRDFIIGSTLVLRARASSLGRGYITVDSIDGKAAMVYNLVWKRCS